MATKWQYKVTFYEPKHGSFNTGELEQELDKLGRDGWELASLLEHGSGDSASDFTIVLKKPTE